jgi:hypothetical protein
MFAVYLALLLPASLVTLLVTLGAVDTRLLPSFIATALVAFFTALTLFLAAARWGKSKPNVDTGAIGRWSCAGAFFGAPILVLVASWLEVTGDHLFQFGIGSLCGVTLAIAIFLGLAQARVLELHW